MQKGTPTKARSVVGLIAATLALMAGNHSAPAQSAVSSAAPPTTAAMGAASYATDGSRLDFALGLTSCPCVGHVLREPDTLNELST